MNPEVFNELSIILLITVVITGLMNIFRQPAIIGYILSGIVAGPMFLNIIDSTDTLSAFSQIGIALLLFLVGLNLNPNVIRKVGKVSLITGLGQVIFTTSIGYGIGRLLGFSAIESLYMAIALTFSSTIVIMKLISDKKDLETLYGRISVGFLIIQDFIAILILLLISTLNTGISFATLAFETLLKAVGAISILLLLTIYILPKLTRMVAKSQEFLMLFSLSWCFIIASAFHHLSFSIEAGALLAGITLSMSPYHFEISSKMRPLRDFFLILFFIVLGSQMVFTNILSHLPVILIFSIFVLIGNPIIVMVLMGMLGYTKRNGFLAGLTVAQISEFSLILIAMGISLNQINSEILSIITPVALITFAGSTYLIMYAHRIYPHISKYLSIFEKKGRKIDEHKYHEHDEHDIILFGYNRIGLDILETLKKIKKKFLIVDYDPDVITKLSKQGFDCRYGDANDLELLNEVNLSNAKMVISTISEVETNILLIKKVQQINKNAIIAVVSHEMDEAEELYEYGATYVIMPHFLGGQHFSTMIERNKMSMERFLEEKIAHLEHIRYKNRK